MNTVTSFALAGPYGIDAFPLTIECRIDATKPDAFAIMGVATLGAKEIRVRVRSALEATGFQWPSGRITIIVESSVAPQAPPLDLPIALAIAGMANELEGVLVAGELGLDGYVRPIRGAFQAALLAEKLSMRGVLTGNAREVAAALEGSSTRPATIIRISPTPSLPLWFVLSQESDSARPYVAAHPHPDFSDVRCQPEAIEAIVKSRLREALVLSGPPGVGKTMIARRIPSVLPPMTRDEQIEVTCVYSALGLCDGLVTQRPFRAPHHTISIAALVGGGDSAKKRPGEVYLAMHGVLFLDEITEFSFAAIEALAGTLKQMSPSCRPLLVASTNPCPCGWRDSEARVCVCSDSAHARFQTRTQHITAQLGFPIVVSLRASSLQEPKGESSASIAALIQKDNTP